MPQVKVQIPMPDGKIVLATIDVFGEYYIPEPPIDPPEPADPYKGYKPVITKVPQNVGTEVQFLSWMNVLDRYQRWQTLEVITGPVAKIAIRGYNLASGGTLRALGSKEYVLYFDGVEVARTPVYKVGAQVTEFSVPLADIPVGWKRMTLGGLGPGETNRPDWAYHIQDGIPMPEQKFMPIVRNSYDVVNSVIKDGIDALVPAQYKPIICPLPKRHFVKPKSGSCVDLYKEDLVPIVEFDTYLPNTNWQGIKSTRASQPYYYSPQMISRMPTTMLLDGPRGMASCIFATNIICGTAVVNGEARHNTYVTEPWSVSRIDSTGYKTTLAGWRSKDGVVGHWADGSKLEFELVGDWDAVPADRRGFWEPWGTVFDERTTVIDTGAPLINGEHPHPGTVIMFVADSQYDRICKLELNGKIRNAKAKVTEFITGIKDPWGLVIRNGVLYVCERQSNRITKYSADTGALLGVFVQGAGQGAYIDQQIRRPKGINLFETRKAECCLPEGLAWPPGDWIYYASMAQAQVRKKNVVTGEMKVAVDGSKLVLTAKAQFFHIEVDDGRFLQEGNIYLSTWSEERQGYPYIYGPDGVERASWWPAAERGAGNWADQLHYGSSAGIGDGHMIVGGMAKGLIRVSGRQVGDKEETQAVRDGRVEWSDKFYRGIYGFNAYNPYGLDLPWGESAKMDAFMEFYERVRPAADPVASVKVLATLVPVSRDAPGISPH